VFSYRLVQSFLKYLSVLLDILEQAMHLTRNVMPGPCKICFVRFFQLCGGLKYWMLSSQCYLAYNINWSCTTSLFLKASVMLIFRQTVFVKMYKSKNRLQRHFKYIHIYF